VACEPLAQRRRQGAVPAVQQASRVRALATCRPRGQQHVNQFREPGADPRGQRLRLATRDAQSIREVSALELITQVQLDKLALGRLQASERGSDEVPKFHIADIGVVPIAGHLGGVSGRSRQRTGTRAVVALVTGNGE
jgi:hypothetical protein